MLTYLPTYSSYTSIILNVTPVASMLDETVNTLSYASLARHVATRPEQHKQIVVLVKGR